MNIRTVLGGTAAAIALTMAGAPAKAQEDGAEGAEQSEPRQPPRCEAEEFRAFDFWIGEWEVRTRSGQLAGHNSIQPTANGCGLTENYSMGGNPAGESLNYYDQARGVWGQTWISPGILIQIEGGSPNEGVMTMSGTITYRNRPMARGFAARWSAQEDGTVLQQFWEQNPETGEWSDWFTGIYTRRD